MKRSWTVVLVVAGLYLLADWSLSRGAGLTRSVASNLAVSGLPSERVAAIDLDGLDARVFQQAGLILDWQGVWDVPAPGVYDIAIESHGASTWRIDGHRATDDASGGARTVWLDAGFHRIDVTYSPTVDPRLIVSAARSGEVLSPLPGSALRPRPPTHPRVRAAGLILARTLGWSLLAALVLAIRRSSPVVLAWWAKARARVGARDLVSARTVAWALLTIILIHGALLRLDAITARYGVVTSPRWVAAIQTRASPAPEWIRPSAFRWEAMPLYEHLDGPATHYRGDPYTYLEAAREMTSFYAAHYREPVFPFATRVSLALFDNQDVAVSFASMAFSVLSIWLIYILGVAAWSKPAGLFAAFAWSINQDAVSLASLGWRDDAFVAAVVLGAYGILKCWRAWREPADPVRIGPLQIERAYLYALALGAATGLIVLVRFMAFSFLVPGILVALLTSRLSWRRRLAVGGLALLTAAIVSGPYFVNCWRVYGDPLFTFNVHGDVYSVAEGKGATHQGTLAYVYGKLAERPMAFIDTVAQGMTSYPFTNKWVGLDGWLSGFGRWASLAAIAGCVVLAASASGRLLLLLMVASQLPFSYTWTVDPHWRFTAHVYPFLLIAAAAGAGTMIALVRRMLVLEPPAPRGEGVPVGRRLVAWTAVAGSVWLAAWLIARVFPSGVFAEDLRLRSDAMVTAGDRDGAFFAGGWSSVTRAGNVRTRVAIGEGRLSIPLPAVDDYGATLRLDPFPRPLGDSATPLPMLDVILNGTPIAALQLAWTPERVGSYDVVLPRALVRRGANALTLRLRQQTPGREPAFQPGLSDGEAFALWYVRVHPAR